MFLATTTPEGSAIGVLFPADIAQQASVGGMKANQVAPAAMVWSENQFLRRQLQESALDVTCLKFRTVPPDGDNFVIAELGDSFDRILETRCEISSSLSMD